MIPITKSQKIWVTTGLILVGATNVMLVRMSSSEGWGYFPAFVYTGLYFGLLVVHYLRPFCLWEKMVAFFAAGCIIALKGFGYIGIPFGKGFLPIGEMIILSALILIPHNRSLPTFFKEKVSWWIFAWFAYGMVRLLMAIPDIEFITLKSSCMIYYSLFVYFGFLLARRREAADQFFTILGISFLLLFLHYLFYSRHLGNLGLSPKVCYGINLFGSFGSPYFHTISACFFFIVIAKYYLKWPHWIHSSLATIFLALTIVMQARSGFVALTAAIIIAMLWSDIRQKIKLGNSIILLVFAFIIVTSLIGIQIKGGRGPVKPDYLIMQLKTIFGISGGTYERSSPSSPHLSSESLLGTRQGRMEIWKDIISDNLESPRSLLLGKGFQEPLLKIKLGKGVPCKKSPHNGYVLIFGYLGLIGLFLFLIFNFLFVKMVIKAIRINRAKGRLKESDTLLWVFLYYTVMITSAFTSPIFGASYRASIFYFLIGLGLSLSRQGKAAYAASE